MQKHLRAWGDEERRLGRLMQGQREMETQMKRWWWWCRNNGSGTPRICMYPSTLQSTTPSPPSDPHPPSPWPSLRDAEEEEGLVVVVMELV